MLFLSWRFWEEVGQTSGTTKSMLGPASELRINSLAHNSILSQAFGKPVSEQAG